MTSSTLKKIFMGFVFFASCAALFLLMFKLARLAPSTSPYSMMKESPNFGQVQDFDLIDQDNKPFGLKNLKGKVWTVGFVFTRCQGPCPLISARMAEVQEAFKDQPDFTLVSVSVDPEYDQPAVLKKYAGSLKAREGKWTFLTGDKAEIKNLMEKNFHVGMGEPMHGPAGVDINHSMKLVLVDRNAKILGYYHGLDQEALAALKKKIRQAL